MTDLPKRLYVPDMETPAPSRSLSGVLAGPVLAFSLCRRRTAPGSTSRLPPPTSPAWTSSRTRAPPPPSRGRRDAASGAHHDHPWTLVCTPGGPVRPPTPARERTGDAEPVVVVPVPGRIPVAVRRTEVPRFVVPGAAAQHTLAGGWSGFGTGSNHPALKIAWRRRHVCACSAWAIQARTRCSTSTWVTVPFRQRSLRPRNRLRKRRTFSSGRRLRPPGSRTKPRKVEGSLVAATWVFAG